MLGHFQSDTVSELLLLNLFYFNIWLSLVRQYSLTLVVTGTQILGGEEGVTIPNTN